MVRSDSLQALSHEWITRTDLGLYHTSGSSARQVPRPSPAIACGKLPTKQLSNGNTQETTVFHIQAQWSHVMMEKGASGDVPAHWHMAHARAGARQKFSLPYQNYSSQKYSLQLAPAHRTPHLQMQKHATLHVLSLFTKDIWEKYPRHSKAAGKVMSITPL